MHAKKALAHPSDTVFIYDGSFEGFLCCLHECVYSKRIPAAVYTFENAEPTLFDTVEITSDITKAKKVYASLGSKISPRAQNLIENVHNTFLPNKEMHMLSFALMGYQIGQNAAYMLGDSTTSPLIKAERHLMREAHLFTGFVRFSDYEDSLVAVIHPKNFVLPYIASHFVRRFNNENFLIFDKVHKAALVYYNKKYDIIHMDDLVLENLSAKEVLYREMWKKFYDTIAIKERVNPKLRMSLMPKRYWADMPEMADSLGKNLLPDAPQPRLEQPPIKPI